MAPQRRISFATKLVLLAFTQADRPLYAREIARATQQYETSVGHIVARLNEDGWLEKVAEPQRSPVGPPRTYYTFTELGRESAQHILDQNPGLARSQGTLDFNAVEQPAYGLGL